MDFMQWLTGTKGGEFLWTILVSMVPVVELRGGIPFGVAAGLPVWAAYLAAVIGNMLPVPFIVVYIRRIFQWMRRRIPKLNSLVDRLERKAHLKGQTVSKYKYLGLAIFVAIPLPGTGGLDRGSGGCISGHALEKGHPLCFCRRGDGGISHQRAYLWGVQLVLREGGCLCACIWCVMGSRRATWPKPFTAIPTTP